MEFLNRPGAWCVSFWDSSVPVIAKYVSFPSAHRSRNTIEVHITARYEAYRVRVWLAAHEHFNDVRFVNHYRIKRKGIGQLSQETTLQRNHTTYTHTRTPLKLTSFTKLSRAESTRIGKCARARDTENHNNNNNKVRVAVLLECIVFTYMEVFNYWFWVLYLFNRRTSSARI